MAERVNYSQIHWAHSYDGYRRIASDSQALLRLLETARNEYRSRGRIPDWCGVDYLRAWAFYLVRADRFAGGGTLGDEWVAVLDAVRGHPDATGPDVPPPLLPDDVPLPSRFSDKPKMHRDSGFLAAKQSRWFEPHVAPINQFVDEIRSEVAAGWRHAHGDAAPPVFVPYVDPDSGGIRARVLFLLESPAGPAALGSRMLSADNNDETAKNVWNAYAVSGMPRTWGLHWNAVPWYVGDGKKNKAVKHGEIEQGRRFLEGLLALAPGINVVLAMGKAAQRSVATLTPQLEAQGILVMDTPHPGPIPAATTKGQSLQEFHGALSSAMRLVAHTP